MKILSVNIPMIVIVLAVIVGAVVLYRKYGDRILNAATVA